MAEIVRIQVQVSGAKPANDTLLKLRETVDYLNKTPVNLKFNAVELSKSAKALISVNKELEKTKQKQLEVEAAVWKVEAAEKQRETARIKRDTAEINRDTRKQKAIEMLIQGQRDLAIQEEKTAQAKERTRQTEERTIQTQERTRQAEERTAQAKERTAQTTERARMAQEKANTAARKGADANTLLGTSLTGLVTRFVSLHMLLFRTVSAFRDALKTMKEVDSALVTIQKTTGFTGQQLGRLTNSAYELANAYGRTATEILNAASVYARAGFKDNLDQMTELSALLQNVGDLEGEVASKFLIATNAAWKLNGSYDALMGVIDGLNAQTNQAAVDMEGLTSGITVAGSVFASAGETVQTFAGMLGAGIALTARSGSEVGRGLRTIAMNIRQIKGELEDGEIIDEESISDAAAALHSVGISVADANGELRLTSEVLDELAGRWDSLTSAEKSYLAQSLAGKRQANILISLMQNWEEAQRQMELYANGAGSALKENEIYMDSWEAKTKQLSAAWTKFVNNLVDTKLIKNALDALIKLVDLLDSKFGRFVITVGGISTAFVALVGAIKGVTAAVAAMNGVMALNPLFLAAAGVTAGIYLLVKALEDVTSKADEYAQAAKETYAAYQSTQGEIDSLKSKTEELTDQERARLEILKEEARLQKEQAAEQAKQALAAKYSVYTMSYDELQYKLEKAPRSEAADIINAMRKLENGKGLPQTSGGTGIPQYAGMLIGQYNDVKKALEDAFKDHKSLEELNKLEEESRELQQSIIDLSKELLEYSEIMGDEFPEEAQTALRYLNIVIDAFDGVRESTKKAGEAADQATEPVNRLREKMKAASDEADNVDEAFTAVTEALKKYGEGSVQVYDAMQKLEETIPGATEGLYDLETAAWEVESAEYADKAALLDFVDAAQQAKLQPLIDEMERASTAALELAGSIAIAMPGGYNDQFLEAYKAENNPALQKLKAQKADLDAWVGALRGRSDYSGTSGGGGGSSSSSSDPELARLQNIVKLRKQEVEFLKASGKSQDEINAKQKEVQAALHDLAEYMRKIEADEADILSLSTEWWTIQNSMVEVEEDQLKVYQDRVSLLKSQLSLLEAQGAGADTIEAKQREIQDALKAQMDYMESIGASQAEINALATEWWNIENNILDTHKKLFDELKKTIDEYYDAAVTDKEKELQLEEKILAVQKAQIALQNAQEERNVRYFNAASGQWEWGANAKNVQSAEEALSKAKDALVDYQEQAAWAEFKAAWEYIAGKIRSGDTTFDQAYRYMKRKMVELQNKYNVDMGDVLEDSVGAFEGVNKTITDLDGQTAEQLGASVKSLTDANTSLGTAVGTLDTTLTDATTNASNAVDAFKSAFDTAKERVENGEWDIDKAFKYLRRRAREISKTYGVDMTKALNDAIGQMQTVYSGLNGISQAVQEGALTPKEAFDIISKALNAVSEQYGEDIAGEVNRILAEEGGFESGIDDLAAAVASGKLTWDEAFKLLTGAVDKTSEKFGIDGLQGELDTAIQNMGKSSGALEGLWKTIVMNKMRMNSVSWLNLEEQKKQAQAMGDEETVKRLTEQQNALHAENEALGKTIGATYDKSGYWSLNGQNLYDPQADKASGKFDTVTDSGVSPATTGSSKAGGNQDLLDTKWKSSAESHLIPGLGYVNTGEATADLFNLKPGQTGAVARAMLMMYGTDEEKTQYFNGGGIPASLAERLKNQPQDFYYSIPPTSAGIYDIFKGSTNAKGQYSGGAIVYKGGAGDSVVQVKNGKVMATGLQDMGSDIILTPDGRAYRMDSKGNLIDNGETWSNGLGDLATQLVLLTAMFRDQQAMADSGNFSNAQIYGSQFTYDEGGVLHGLGGIKATARDEMILPPDITERILRPTSNAFVDGRMDGLRAMLGMRTEFGSAGSTKIGTQNNGDNYIMNGVSISEGKARSTTVYELAQMARSLGSYQRS